jgi:myo-inositol-1(or 4)-monophosphatase
MSICEAIIIEIKLHLNDIISLRQSFVSKSDGSYVSKGDLLVQSIVIDFLKKYLPCHVLISEELAPFDNTTWIPTGSYFVLDPIDGTENFVSGLREWGVGISIYTDGIHKESCIYLPEIGDEQCTGMPIKKYKSRIYGLSSSLNKSDLIGLPDNGFEYRIIGCSMYNMLAVVRGSFVVFENVNGVHCWDVLPGLNLALESGCEVLVDDRLYTGEILFPVKKYKIKISNLGKICTTN